MALALNVQSSTSGGSSSILTIIGIIVLVFIGYYIYKNIYKAGKAAPAAAPPPTGDIATQKIYPDASPPQECAEPTDGELEQDGDRKEPQIACGFDFLNTEATVYVNATGINDTLSVKLRGPKHGGSTPEAEMCNVIHYINLGSSNKEAFGKQSHHTGEYCEMGGSSVSIPDGTWVGVKAIEWNEGSGVHCQTYLDNPEGSGWQLAADFVDNGNAGSCQGQASEAYTTSPCQGGSQPVSIGFRVDGLKGGGDVQFKNISVREITPPAAGEGTTTEETPTEEEDDIANLARSFTEFNHLSYRSVRLGNF